MLERLRKCCLAFPAVTERPSHGTPTFFYKARRSFAMVWLEGHHANEFAHLWCAAPPGAQEFLMDADPSRFFRPPYVGSRGWVGVRLDGVVDWEEVADL